MMEDLRKRLERVNDEICELKEEKDAILKIISKQQKEAKDKEDLMNVLPSLKRREDRDRFESREEDVGIEITHSEPQDERTKNIMPEARRLKPRGGGLDTSGKITDFEKEMAQKPREQVFYKEKQFNRMAAENRRLRAQVGREADLRAQESMRYASMQHPSRQQRQPENDYDSNQGQPQQQHASMSPQRPLQDIQARPPRQQYYPAPQGQKGLFARLWANKFLILLVVIILVVAALIYSGRIVI